MENSVIYTNEGHCSIGSIIMADFESGGLCLGTVTGVHSDNKSYSYSSGPSTPGYLDKVVTRELVDVRWFFVGSSVFPPRSMRLHCEKL